MIGKEGVLNRTVVSVSVALEYVVALLVSIRTPLIAERDRGNATVPRHR